MPPTKRVHFVRDFFFTDIMNHLEFLKWTGTLEKDDEVLLVYILERLASTEPVYQIQPFYGSVVQHQSLPKNALHLAKAYAEIQRLSGHEYNVFEFAFLDPDCYHVRAMVAFTIQVGFLACLVIYNIFEEGIVVTPDEDGFELIVAILAMSSLLLFSEVRTQSKNAEDFNRVMYRISNHHYRRFWLYINSAINTVLGGLVFLFNIYFILVSDTPTDAVLNSVALAFIMEIDDVFKPNWDEENKEDALAELLKQYILEDFDPNDIHVTVRGANDLLNMNLNMYVHLEEWDPASQSFHVNVYIVNDRNPKTHVALTYEKLEYIVSGKRAAELHDALSGFHCLENLEDILKSCHDVDRAVEPDVEAGTRVKESPTLETEATFESRTRELALSNSHDGEQQPMGNGYSHQNGHSHTNGHLGNGYSHHQNGHSRTNGHLGNGSSHHQNGQHLGNGSSHQNGHSGHATTTGGRSHSDRGRSRSRSPRRTLEKRHSERSRSQERTSLLGKLRRHHHPRK